jgi:hypothetical protein
MRTLPETQRINFGNNGTVSLFYGAEVQLAQASTLASLDALIQSRLDVAVSSRLATATPNVNLTSIRGFTLIGTGTPGDEFGV